MLRNAEAEGVIAHIEVREGDARRLPFRTQPSTLLVSNFVVHEVDTPQETASR